MTFEIQRIEDVIHLEDISMRVFTNGLLSVLGKPDELYICFDGYIIDKLQQQLPGIQIGSVVRDREFQFILIKGERDFTGHLYSFDAKSMKFVDCKKLFYVNDTWNGPNLAVINNQLFVAEEEQLVQYNPQTIELVKKYPNQAYQIHQFCDFVLFIDEDNVYQILSDGSFQELNNSICQQYVSEGFIQRSDGLCILDKDLAKIQGKLSQELSLERFGICQLPSNTSAIKLQLNQKHCEYIGKQSDEMLIEMKFYQNCLKFSSAIKTGITLSKFIAQLQQLKTQNSEYLITAIMKSQLAIQISEIQFEDIEIKHLDEIGVVYPEMTLHINCNGLLNINGYADKQYLTYDGCVIKELKMQLPGIQIGPAVNFNDKYNFLLMQRPQDNIMTACVCKFDRQLLQIIDTGVVVFYNQHLSGPNMACIDGVLLVCINNKLTSFNAESMEQLQQFDVNALQIYQNGDFILVISSQKSYTYTKGNLKELDKQISPSDYYSEGIIDVNDDLCQLVPTLPVLNYDMDGYFMERFGICRFPKALPLLLKTYYDGLICLGGEVAKEAEFMRKFTKKFLVQFKENLMVSRFMKELLALNTTNSKLLIHALYCSQFQNNVQEIDDSESCNYLITPLSDYLEMDKLRFHSCSNGLLQINGGDEGVFYSYSGMVVKQLDLTCIGNQIGSTVNYDDTIFALSKLPDSGSRSARLLRFNPISQKFEDTGRNFFVSDNNHGPNIAIQGDFLYLCENEKLIQLKAQSLEITKKFQNTCYQIFQYGDHIHFIDSNKNFAIVGGKLEEIENFSCNTYVGDGLITRSGGLRFLTREFPNAVTGSNRIPIFGGIANEPQNVDTLNTLYIQGLLSSGSDVLKKEGIFLARYPYCLQDLVKDKLLFNCWIRDLQELETHNSKVLLASIKDSQYQQLVDLEIVPERFEIDSFDCFSDVQEVMEEGIHINSIGLLGINGMPGSLFYTYDGYSIKPYQFSEQSVDTQGQVGSSIRSGDNIFFALQSEDEEDQAFVMRFDTKTQLITLTNLVSNCGGYNKPCLGAINGMLYIISLEDGHLQSFKQISPDIFELNQEYDNHVVESIQQFCSYVYIITDDDKNLLINMDGSLSDLPSCSYDEYHGEGLVSRNGKLCLLKRAFQKIADEEDDDSTLQKFGICGVEKASQLLNEHYADWLSQVPGQEAEGKFLKRWKQSFKDILANPPLFKTWLEELKELKTWQSQLLVQAIQNSQLFEIQFQSAPQVLAIAGIATVGVVPQSFSNEIQELRSVLSQQVVANSLQSQQISDLKAENQDMRDVIINQSNEILKLRDQLVSNTAISNQNNDLLKQLVEKFKK